MDPEYLMGFGISRNYGRVCTFPVAVPKGWWTCTTRAFGRQLHLCNDGGVFHTFCGQCHSERNNNKKSRRYISGPKEKPHARWNHGKIGVRARNIPWGRLTILLEKRICPLPYSRRQVRRASGRGQPYDGICLSGLDTGTIGQK